MNELELQDWLINTGIQSELSNLTRQTVGAEIENLTTIADKWDPTEEWDRLMLAGSILTRSNLRRHQDASLRIATAALMMGKSEQVKDAGAILLEKLSNHRAVELAGEKKLLSPDIGSRLGVTMRLESQRRKIEDTILLESSGEWLQVNDFQKDFWRTASMPDSWLSASAPTASGKTFLVLKWLIDRLSSGASNVAVYIAPTRALVGEIETTLRELVREEDRIDISSLPLAEHYMHAKASKKRLILVFTQERLHLLLNALGDEGNIDLLIVDEAQKIGDSQRGVILQDAIERVSRLNHGLKAIFVSPATQNPKVLLDDAPDSTNAFAIDSDSSTVLQNIITAKPMPGKPKQWKMDLVESGGNLELGTLSLHGRPTNLRKRLAFIAAAAGNKGGTLVYVNGAAEAEGVAQLIRDVVGGDKCADVELGALADLIRKGVHPKYQLASLVDYGVAFHYGNMPSLVRLEVERLFREGKIKFLVCTSTLIEGVNLSCRTIVVRGPRKGRDKPMEPHDFWNLAGRAGRWGSEFQGNIICVDPDDLNAWPNGVPKRSRYPIHRETDTVLNEGVSLYEYVENRGQIELNEGPDVKKFEQVTAYLLSTHLRLGSIKEAPFARRHDEKFIALLDGSLNELAKKIEIPLNICYRNPGVNAVGLQNLLNSFRLYPGDIENLLPVPPESFDAYDRMVTIMKRVNANIYPAFQPEKRTPLYALVVQEWLKGLSLAEMIRRRIAYKIKMNQKLNLPSLIRDTMDLVEQIARFRAPKYLSAYSDVLNLFLMERGREDLVDDGIDIGTALEFGVSSRTLLSLLSLGLSRMGAVMLYEYMYNDDMSPEDCKAWINDRSDEFEGMGLPSIVVNEARKKALD